MDMRHDERDPPAEVPDRSTRSAAPLALAVAAAAALAAGLLLADAGESWRWALALPLLLGGGVAFGPLLLLTPVEPSPLKLAVFASLLSPPLAAAIWSVAVFGAGLAPGPAWALVFGLASILALLAARKRVARASLGRAAWAAIVVGSVAGVAALLAARTAGGLDERLRSPASVAHVTIAEALGRGAPLVNPWLTGGELDVRPPTGAFLAALAGPANLTPLYTFPFVRGWSLLAIALLAYLAAAVAFREYSQRSAAARNVLAALLALAALGIEPAFGSVLDGQLPEGRWLETDPARMLARVYALAALLAGLHAVRRGARPWPGLCALMVCVCALLQPWMGVALVLALVPAAIAAKRARIAPLFLLALLPAFTVGRVFGGFAGEQVERAVGGADQVAWRPFALLAVPTVLFLIRRRSLLAHGAERRVVRAGLVALGLAVIVPVATAVWIVPARGDTDALAAFALLPLALVASAGFVSLGRPSIGGSLALVLIAVSAVGALRTVGALWQAALPPVEDRPAGLVLTTSRRLTEELGAAYEWLRSSEYARRPRAALLRGESRPNPRGLPSLAPLLAGIGLWSDVIPPPGSRQDRFGVGTARLTGQTDLGDTWGDRVGLLSALFLEERAWEPRFDRVLRAESARGTTLVFIVTEADRRRTTDRGVGPRGSDTIVRRLGAVPIFERDEVVVYVLEPSGG